MNGKKTLRREPLTDNALLMVIAVCIFTAMYAAAMLFLGGGFLRVQQFFNILNDNAALIIVACGLTVVMIGGGIDISVGGVIALVAMVCTVYMNTEGASIPVAVLIAVGIGLAFGVVQGTLVSYLGIQPFIVSLAGMFFARGMTTIVSVNPQKVALPAFKQLMATKLEFPFLGYYGKKGNLIPARLELGVVVALTVLVVMAFVLRKTRLGRNFYAVGGNPNSALMLGINVRFAKFCTYVISGTLAGIAGFVLLMHTGAGNATNASGAEMNAIASSIIGGTLLSGGVGNVFGTFVGVLTLATIKAIVPASGLTEPWWQSITTGAMLCLFILMQSVVLGMRGKGKRQKQ
ncbi:MAG: sugar ABC transporter permease YjfF [Clostridia bacterium]|nr:sugar ABC transporter permease YjfF [Clostridia bacterium]